MGKIGKIKPHRFYDHVLEKEFQVTVSDLYTVIRIGQRNYYFNKDGNFDGTGVDSKGTVYPKD